MARYKVSFEIDVEAESSLEAAYKVNHMMDHHLLDPEAEGWQFYVQEENSIEVFSVDLAEEEGSEVLPVKNYIPNIQIVN